MEIKRGAITEPAGAVSVERLSPGESRQCFGVDFYLKPEVAAMLTEEAEIELESRFIKMYKAKERV